MRLLYFLFLYILLLLSVFSGCSGTAKSNNHLVAGQDNDSKFPVSLVGTWKCYQQPAWELTFDAEGSLSLLKHYLPNVVIDMKEGVAFEEGVEGAHCVYEMGPHEVNYDPQICRLSVKITVDYFYTKLPVGEFEGKGWDILSGQISKDRKTWRAEWLSYMEITSFETPDPNELVPRKLIFKKVAQNLK